MYVPYSVSETDIAIIEKKLLNTLNVILSKKKRIAMQNFQNRNVNKDNASGWFNIIKRSVSSPTTSITQQG